MKKLQKDQKHLKELVAKADREALEQLILDTAKTNLEFESKAQCYVDKDMEKNALMASMDALLLRLTGLYACFCQEENKFISDQAGMIGLNEKGSSLFAQITEIFDSLFWMIENNKAFYAFEHLHQAFLSLIMELEDSLADAYLEDEEAFEEMQLNFKIFVDLYLKKVEAYKTQLSPSRQAELFDVLEKDVMFSELYNTFMIRWLASHFVDGEQMDTLLDLVRRIEKANKEEPDFPGVKDFYQREGVDIEACGEDFFLYNCEFYMTPMQLALVKGIIYDKLGDYRRLDELLNEELCAPLVEYMVRQKIDEKEYQLAQELIEKARKKLQEPDKEKFLAELQGKLYSVRKNTKGLEKLVKDYFEQENDYSDILVSLLMKAYGEDDEARKAFLEMFYPILEEEFPVEFILTWLFRYSYLDKFKDVLYTRKSRRFLDIIHELTPHLALIDPYRLFSLYFDMAWYFFTHRDEQENYDILVSFLFYLFIYGVQLTNLNEYGDQVDKISTIMKELAEDAKFRSSLDRFYRQNRELMDQYSDRIEMLWENHD